MTATDTIEVDIPDRWYGLVGVYGGYALAVVADAAQCVPGSHLVSLTARFLAPVERERATVVRTVVHRGRATASVRLELHQAGRLTIDASAVLLPMGDATPAIAPLPDDRRPATDGPPADWPARRFIQGDLAFLGNLETRTPERFATSEGSSAWLRLAAPPETLGLRSPAAVACALMDVLLPTPYGDEPHPAFVPTIEFSVHFTPLIGTVGDGWVYGRNLPEWTTDEYCVEDATLTTATGALLSRQRQTRLIRWTIDPAQPSTRGASR